MNRPLFRLRQSFGIVQGLSTIFIIDKSGEMMTPAQCRAARALLDVTQTQLANAARLGLSTVVDFERERRPVSQEAVDAIKATLAANGIVFLDENGGGAGLRFRKTAHARAKGSERERLRLSLPVGSKGLGRMASS